MWGLGLDDSLLEACRNGDAEAVKVLLADGAEPSIADANGRSYPFCSRQYACIERSRLLESARCGKSVCGSSTVVL